MDRGVVVPVPALHRDPGARRIRLNANRRHARRLSEGLEPKVPDEIVQIDTRFVNVRPGTAIKHLTAYDPVARWTTGHVATRRRPVRPRGCATSSLPRRPSRSGHPVDGGCKFKAALRTGPRDEAADLYVLPPKSPKLSSLPQA